MEAARAGRRTFLNRLRMRINEPDGDCRRTPNSASVAFDFKNHDRAPQVISTQFSHACLGSQYHRSPRPTAKD